MSMLGLAGAAGLIYGAVFGSLSLSVRIAAWAAALTGIGFFGSNLVLSFLALSGRAMFCSIMTSPPSGVMAIGLCHGRR
ncbi:hypothetical protein WJ0W_003473 [Paenibacillus melissococcoides]|uniref:Major facilitator superfamily (MFS) profile domain-containing protein n=1 Tax=Paenibacillus melissococcoides TaxID=2912268 RepID=A0ABM9G3X0_9BACL|nr:hypothetical protein WJ0W_003473 [Paenibacillus melissococcoides]